MDSRVTDSTLFDIVTNMYLWKILLGMQAQVFYSRVQGYVYALFFYISYPLTTPEIKCPLFAVKC